MVKCRCLNCFTSLLIIKYPTGSCRTRTYFFLFGELQFSQVLHVGTAPSIKQHAYRVNPRKREILGQEVEYLLTHDLAEPSFSAWSSSVCWLISQMWYIVFAPNIESLMRLKSLTVILYQGVMIVSIELAQLSLWTNLFFWTDTAGAFNRSSKRVVCFCDTWQFLTV